jgi:hypothetical protein
MSQITLQTLDFSSLGFPSVGEFYLGVDVDGLPKLRRSNDTLILSATSSSYIQYFSITHSDFVNLINTSSLSPGSIYIINDFRTSHYIQYTDSIGDGTGLGESVNFGSIEPLAVVATSNNTYDSDVKSLVHPDDEIKWKHELIDREYDHYNNPAGVGRGHIIYRKSVAGNSRDYDFRNVVFWRWNDGSGNYTVVKRIDAPNIFDYKVYKSFEEGFTFLENNEIGSWPTNQLGIPYYFDNLIISTSSIAAENNIKVSHGVTIDSSNFSGNNIVDVRFTKVFGEFTLNYIGSLVNSNILSNFAQNNSSIINSSTFSYSFDGNRIQRIESSIIGGTAIGNNKFELDSVVINDVYSFNQDPLIIDYPLSSDLILLKNGGNDILKVTTTMSSAQYGSQSLLIDSDKININGDFTISTLPLSSTYSEVLVWDSSLGTVSYNTNLSSDINNLIGSVSTLQSDVNQLQSERYFIINDVTTSPYFASFSTTPREYFGVSYSSTTYFNLPTFTSTSDGKILTIKDESGLASINPIIIGAGTFSIDGVTQSTLAINYGSLTLLKKSNGWWII